MLHIRIHEVEVVDSFNWWYIWKRPRWWQQLCLSEPSDYILLI